MPSKSKDTIYIDTDDDITSIIDKVNVADSNIVALVLPKRTPTLQSLVNLKLLKRSADNSSKNLVLITSDHNLLPLAGVVKISVAKSLQSKPQIPQVNNSGNSSTSINTADDTDTADPDNILNDDLSEETTIDLDNEADLDLDQKKLTKTRKIFNKRLKIPDFDKFRLFMFGGIGLLLVIVGLGIYAFVIAPRANIVIKTDTSSISTDLTLTAKTDAKEVDKDAKIVPAVKKEFKKSESQKVPATGEKNTGDKAKGTITLTNCSASDNQLVIAAGTTISSTNYLFTTDIAVTLPQSVFSGGGSCLTASKSVTITAKESGDSYNLSTRAYLVSGYSGVNADGGDMKGGTNKIIKVVSQKDLDGVKQALSERINATAVTDLKAQFESENLVALDDTISANEPVLTSAPKVNEEASETTVTLTTTYKELGIKKDDIKSFVEELVNQQIDLTKQSIQDIGIDKSVIRVLDNKSSEQATVSVATISIAGPQLDAEGIKRDIAGKKKGETVRLIQERPGIRDVEVEYSPFWVFSTPKRINRITVTFEHADAN